MQVKIRILRFDPSKDAKPYFRDYKIDNVEPMWRVLDCLNEIRWKQDGTLIYRRSCAHGVCGSDGVKINGENRLACQSLVQDFKTDIITVEPLPALPVIKDLMVDLTNFFEHYIAIKPYLITKTPPPEKERLQNSEDQKKLEDPAKCILCSCCTSSCPSFWFGKKYLGPAALLKAYRFMADTRDEGGEERKGILMGETTGPWRCHTIYNCTEVCPKEIDITRHIQQLKRLL